MYKGHIHPVNLNYNNLNVFNHKRWGRNAVQSAESTPSTIFALLHLRAVMLTALKPFSSYHTIVSGWAAIGSLCFGGSTFKLTEARILTQTHVHLHSHTYQYQHLHSLSHTQTRTHTLAYMGTYQPSFSFFYRSLSLSHDVCKHRQSAVCRVGGILKGTWRAESLFLGLFWELKNSI